MKYLFTICLALLLFIGCKSDKKKIQENAWIGKYAVENYGTKKEYIISGLKFILNFNDSLNIRYFAHQRDIATGPRIYTSAYRISDSLYLDIDEREIGYGYEIYNDSMLLFLQTNDTSQMKLVYERLPNYQQAKNKSNFHQFLSNTAFELYDSLSVDFRRDSSLWSSDLRYFSTCDNWQLKIFDDELFLIVDDWSWYEGYHIKEINEDGFIGIKYGLKNQVFEFKKTKTKLIDKDIFIGQWNAVHGFSKSLRSFDNDINFKPKETLAITDSTINDYRWEINKQHDLIIFPERKANFRNKQWHIVEFNNEKLIINRYCLERNDSCNYRETITFEKTD